MNEVRLDDVVRACAVAGECRDVMLVWPVLLVIDVGDRADGDSENAIGGGGYSSSL